MTRVLATLAAIGVAAIFATACDKDPNPITDLGPDAPACTVTASTGAKDACDRFQAALCDRATECDMFASVADCGTWFASTYGDCTKAGEKPALTEAENGFFVKCLCGLPIASCRQFEQMGLEVTLPDCGKF
jgi:hypothetical protein